LISSSNMVKEFEEILEKLETIYAPLITSEEYHFVPVVDVVDGVFSYLETFQGEADEEERLEVINQSADNIMKQLSLFSEKLSYSSIHIIVFDHFPNLKEISKLLFKFTKLLYKENLSVDEYKSLLVILSYIDNEKIEFKYSLAYRVLKIIFIMTLYHATIYVSILSKLVLKQIALTLDIPA